ncbi:calcium uniporter protein, mitochondrial-like isoform X3 [Pseudoliparis swirei]|uniref:calcium uniporter protein, mitochondrial-like isoform X3 n=1 Tax=Pseudoliparis swirei TaxID=2059687 RepID=UPI0024BD704B|nr:calcium uniporter protein, mitochondrial-like isoform X3 [Pseudoliparis swirei]
MLLSRFFCRFKSPGLRIFSAGPVWSAGLGSGFSSQPPSRGNHDAFVRYSFGRPVLSLSLPAGQQCRFTVTPMLTTVGDLLRDITAKDPGVHTATLLTGGGQRVSSCTFMETVLNEDFQLVINGVTHSVRSLGQGSSHEHVQGVDDVKYVVRLLQAALAPPQRQHAAHGELLAARERLAAQLQPLEAVSVKMAQEAESRASLLGWGGLAYLSLQGGFLGYLTCMIFFSYYVLTKQELIYPDVRDRQFLHFFHQGATQQKFNVNKYNDLKEEMAKVEAGLRTLRRAIRLQEDPPHSA